MLPRFWIFDLDGTLTVAQHDFAALKRRLGLPEDVPVLEGIARHPEAERADLLQAVHDWELDLADRARCAPDALPLLERLVAAGARLGVLTRNTRTTALRTLRAAGLSPYFPERDVLGRTCAAPKPSPEGILLLLERWEAHPGDAVMVGDWVFDLDAGRAAGTSTIYVDRDGTGRWTAAADRTVRLLDELL